MARVELATFDDIITHLVDFLGANPSPESRRDSKRATINALRDVGNAYSWSYYYSVGRVTTVAPYALGTVVYDHTGGTYERMLTLTDGVWPDYAANGLVYIGDIVYEVYSRKSDTVVTLSINSNPGADIVDPTSYTVYRDQFELPCNFQSMGALIISNQSRSLDYVHPNNWLSNRRIWRGNACPYCYAILGDPNYQNTLSLAFYPPPDQVYAIDYLYKRRPRQIKIDSYTDGKISVTAGGLSLTGTGTAFTPNMVGCVVRTGTPTAVPTAAWGNNPFDQERVVIGYNSPTSLSIDAPWDSDANVVKYIISDPIDIDIGSMMSVLLRCAEMIVGVARSRKDRDQLEQAYGRALLLAREADNRNFKIEAVGRTDVWPARIIDFPFHGNAPG